MGPELARRVAPLAVAAVVLAVIGVVWGVLRVVDPAGVGAGSSSGDPAPLRLIGWAPPVSDTPDPRYHLAPGADLPDGPGSAPVRRLAAADAEAAALQTGVPVDGSRDDAPAGWLARSSAGPAYPLVTASEAYDALVHTALPMPMMACPEPVPPDVDQMRCGGPVTVTGARLGLSVQRAEDGVLLVPSWLFDVEGSEHPLVQVAVEPRLVQMTGEPGGGSGGGVTGSAGTVTAAPPTEPATEPPEPPTEPASRFTSVTRGADDRSLDVAFWGGVPACYSYDVRAEEDGRTVRLTVVEHRDPGDTVCIDLAVQVKKTVRLDAPLGQRVVVDAETGEALLGPAR